MFAVFKKKGFWVLTFVVILLLVVAGITRQPRPYVTVFEDYLINVVKPFTRAFYTTGTGSHNVFKMLFEIKDMKEQNQTLTKRVIELENQNVLLEELKQENDRLRRMLNFKTRSYQYTMEVARVIGRNPETWFNMILLDKGERDGITADMAVVTDRGLVARIEEVGVSWSKARLIIDQRSAVSGMIQRTRANGVIKGGVYPIDKGFCQMVYLPENANVVNGDLVISSGLGGVFPKGLVIGWVTEVKEDENGLLKYAVLKPAVDMERLEEIFIITGVSTAEPTEGGSVN